MQSSVKCCGMRTAQACSTREYSTSCPSTLTAKQRPLPCTPSALLRSGPASDSMVMVDRRTLFAIALTPFFVASPLTSYAATALPTPIINPALAPDQSKYDPTDPDLRDAAALLQRALNASTVQEEEALFTTLINRYSASDAPWAAEVVGKALGNRGNARSRQGKLQEALGDYNASMVRCPWSVDPVLNRGVVLEALGRFEEAIDDYRAVLAVAPQDPAAWNNLGNAQAGLGQWKEASTCYATAARLAPEFSFAAANKALALYQLGETDTAVREMRALLRRYPGFDDVRAALTGALWALGKEGDAETNWERVDDPRYKDLSWLAKERRWPPRLQQDLQNFLRGQSV